MVRTVNHDRQPSRYCANLQPHAHFFCDRCGAVYDIPPAQSEAGAAGWQLPPGVVVTHHEVSFQGQCEQCAAQASKP